MSPAIAAMKRAWVADLQVTQDLLALVDKWAPLSVLKIWSKAQLKSAENWAALTHLRASDNPVRVPKCPPHVRKLGSAAAVLDRMERRRRSA